MRPLVRRAPYAHAFRAYVLDTQCAPVSSAVKQSAEQRLRPAKTWVGNGSTPIPNLGGFRKKLRLNNL